MELFLISIALLSSVVLGLSIYYGVVYNSLWETNGSVISLKSDIMEEVNNRWELLSKLINYNGDGFNTEEKVLSKMVKNHKPLSSKSKLGEVGVSEVYYRDTLAQYLTVIGNGPKIIRSDVFNSIMGEINVSEIKIEKLKNKYNDAAKIHNNQYKKKLTSYIAEMNDFPVHEYIE